MDALAFPQRDPGPTTVRLGCDIGQRQDPTALVVTEQEARQDIDHFVVRHLERLTLGTAYPQVVERIVEVTERLERRAWPGRGPRLFDIQLIVDGTGVGLPIADLLTEAGLHPKIVLFTSGTNVNERSDVVHVGKGWMVSRLQVLLQAGRLHFPQVPEVNALVRELQDFRAEVTDRGNARFNAKPGSHDDLITALGLSCGVTAKPLGFTIRSYCHGDPLLEADQRQQERNRFRKPRL